MSIHRSYFNKNNTLIDNNQSNNSQNPVTEISYGTFDALVSRFIFDIDFKLLKQRIDEGLINPNRIVKHVLFMRNTISNNDDYLGGKSYVSTIDRASSFRLDLFKINEEWDEGSGYEFMYNEPIYPKLKKQASNWFERKTNINWDTFGAYNSGTTEIIGSQNFEKGNENISIDITDYVNDRLNIMTGQTGTSYGLGIKFGDEYEKLETEFRQAVAFHTRKTNSWYEPYIETIIDDTVKDDRNYFFLDKKNDLYLYMNIANIPQSIETNFVNIYDNNNELIQTITGDNITCVSKGIYKIELELDSDNNPDAVLYRDEWDITINGKKKTHSNKFYLISEKNYYDFDNSNSINLDNYFFYFSGINENEKITNGGVRKIKLTIKELYPNQNKFLPLDIEYRLFTTVSGNHEIDIIPFTSVNRYNNGYEFNLDTSWLIPQDYKIQIRMKNGHYYEYKQDVSFTIVSNDVF